MSVSIDDLLVHARRGQMEEMLACLNVNELANCQDKDGWNALMWASYHGNVKAIEALLNHGSNLNDKNKSGWTAFMIASMNGHTAVIDTLLSHGVIANEKEEGGATALMKASANGHLAIVETLLKNGAVVNEKDEDGWTAFMLASMNDNAAVMDILLRHGAIINEKDERGETALMWASYYGDAGLVGLLLSQGACVNDKNKYGSTALMKASSNGHVAVMEALLRRGANVKDEDEESRTVLDMACNNEAAVLLSYGVAMQENVDTRFQGGKTALHIIAEANFSSAVKLAHDLIKRGMDVRAKDENDRPPLYYACKAGNTELAASIIHNGGDVNVIDKDDASLLHMAIKNENEGLASLLISSGINVSIKDKQSVRALDTVSHETMRLKLFKENSYTLAALSANHFALWCYFVVISDIEDFESVLVAYCERYGELIRAQDGSGRRAVDIATPANKKAIQSLLLWFGKYRITELRPEHQSATCFVYKAVDEFDLDENGLAKGVALKLMRIKSQFIREIRAREANFDPSHVTNIIETYPPLSELETYPDDLKDEVGDVFGGILSKQQAQKLFCVVMPLGNRNLFVAMKQERFAGLDQEEVRHLFAQLCRCVQHMHERGVIHADIKPLNVMRFEGSWRLIDLDAACRIGIDPVGSKSSSAFVPPEAIYRNDRLGMIGVKSVQLREQLTREFNESMDILIASPAFDIWSLGCILFQLCHSRVLPLFQGGNDDNLSLRQVDSPNLWTLTEYSDAVLNSKLDEMFNPLAANLISQMLERDPSRRPTIERVLAHPFLSQKHVARLLGVTPQFDIFISYRVTSDARHTEYFYNRLTAEGFKVWWDKICLAPGVPWEEGFCQGLVNSRSFVCIVSKGAINHPEKPWNNYSALTQTSGCDNVLLEHRLALELRSLGYIEKIYPVMIGDADNDSVTPSPTYSNFFVAGGKPNAPDVVVESIERKLEEHMEKQALGKPVEANKTVKAVLEEILACQGKLIQGNGNEAFNEAVEAIRVMLMETVKADDEGDGIEHKRIDAGVESVREDLLTIKKKNSVLEDENRSLKRENMNLKQQSLDLRHSMVMEKAAVMNDLILKLKKANEKLMMIKQGASELDEIS